jgi:hypothetical protein
MRLPRISDAPMFAERCRDTLGVFLAAECIRVLDDYEGPGTALAVAKHRETGFTTWLSAGVCKLDAEARALDKCGYSACRNGRDATKCFIASSAGPPFCP